MREKMISREPSQDDSCFCCSCCCCQCLNIPQPESGKEVLYDPNPVCCLCGSGPVRIGTKGQNILLCGKRRESFPYQCILGPDRAMVILTYLLIIGINCAVVPLVAALGLTVQVISITGAVGLLISYTCVACSDPGIIYKDPSYESHQCHQCDVERGAGPKGVEGKGAVTINPVLGDSESRDSEDSDFDSREGKTLIRPNRNRNKGFGSSSSRTRTETLIECGQCGLQRPLSAKHCHDCGVCVDGLDHHCPCK